MSQINSTPRRPGTTQSTALTTRMPYEAGEALLWERQNHRVHAHLSTQMKELQAQHDAYNARIQAIESTAEAAEAAVYKMKQMEAKVVAMEADDQDRPFDAWAKEAISQLQVFVDGQKGVRQKLSGLEQKVGRLDEDVEGVRDTSGLFRSVMRRLEVLESEKREDFRKMNELEKEVKRLKSSSQGHNKAQDEICGDAQADDNPLTVFYGIDTQPRSKQRDFQPSHVNILQEESQSLTLSETQRRHSKHRGIGLLTSKSDLLPPDEEVIRPEEDESELLNAAPEVKYDFKNTRQFKDMQQELEALRAMCRTQEPKSNNQTADTTQHPQETIILPRENNVNFSDATTETEAEFINARRHQPCIRGARSSAEALSSDIQLPSSPPKRRDTQSARRNLMKRPSIYDPRVPSLNEQRQLERPTPNVTAGSEQHTRPPLMVRLPVDTHLVSDRVPAKRKRVEDTLTQRVTRPKLVDERLATKKPVVPLAKAKNVVEKIAFAQPAPMVFSDDVPAPPSPTCKTYGKQKPAVNQPGQQAAPQTSSSKSKQPVALAGQPAVSVAEAVKSRKAISKPRPIMKATIQQQTPIEAVPSRSKKAPAAAKREPKGPRRPAGACKACRSRHQKCDRTYPNCGRCVKAGASCEYPQASDSTTPPSVAPATSPRKKQALLPIEKPAAKAANQGRSVTVSPEAPCDKSPAKCPVPASPSKKATVPTAPTAASSRAPRIKNTQSTRASPKKQK